MLRSTEGPGSQDEPSVGSHGRSLDRGFHEELVEEHRTLLIRCAWIFGALYVVWSFFDYLLVRHAWTLFLEFRLTTLALTVPVVLVFTSQRFRRHVSVGFWIWFFLLGICIVIMLPFTGEAMPTYILGLCLVCWGVGVLPYWSGSWAASNVLTLALPAAIAISMGDSPVGKSLAMFLVLGTAVGITTVSAQFRYRLARKEYRSRKFLESEKIKTQALQMAERERASELARALERAQEVDRLKSDFFANISHELRTPLTLILSPIDELLAKVAPGPDRDALKVVRSNATRLLRMIDDLLDLAKLEAGGLRLRIMRVEMEKLAERVAKNTAPTAKAREIELVFSSEGRSPEIFGDPHRIEIILTNLIGNALKFTPFRGRIEVSVFHCEAGTSVEVTDTGPGISRDEQQLIFDRFHQTETSERRRQGGVGIGLALARELAQLHGGSLTVESEVGKGSTFTLFLQSGKDHLHTEIIERRQLQTDLHPARRVEDRNADVHAHVALEAKPHLRESHRSEERLVLDRGRLPRILVAEDEDDLRGFIVSVLERSCLVDAARNGAEALDLLKQNRPDLVLTDVMMPGVSGLDLTRAIKERPLSSSYSCDSSYRKRRERSSTRRV